MKKILAWMMCMGVAATVSANIITINVTDGGPGDGNASAANIAGVAEGAYIETVSANAVAKNDTNSADLRDTTGANSGVGITGAGFNAGGWAGGGTSGFNAGSANTSDTMMENFTDTSDGTYSFSGLSAWLSAKGATSYEVYVYSDRPHSQVTAGAFTIGTQTYWLATDGADNAHTGPFALSTATTAADALANASANYVKFTGLTGNTFDLNVARNEAAGGSGWINVSGMQIVAIPEPATLGMIAVFGGGMLLIRRKLAM